MPKPKSRRRSGHSAPRIARPAVPGPLVLAAMVLLFAAAAYAPALRVPFIGDDYVFLDKTRTMGFAQLWSRHNTDFGWYRPWSRELHFWVLRSLFGTHELGFRIASIALWLAALLGYVLVAA